MKAPRTGAAASSPTGPAWRRRIYRHPEVVGSRARLGRLVRGLRMLTVVLAVTGCAIESPPILHAPPGPAEAPLPRPPAIISRFGDWNGAGGMPRPWQHSGIDIPAPTGTPALAAADGVVLRTGWGPFAGRYVVLGHGPDLATAYYHLSAIAVTAGQGLRRGEPVGRIGTTGNATGPHLHFGVCRGPEGRCGSGIGDGWVDPELTWVGPNPCLVPGRPLPADERRLTYPVPCTR